MGRAGVAGMGGLVGIEPERTDHQTFMLNFEQPNHTVGAIISRIIATQTSRITFLTFESRLIVSLRTYIHTLHSSIILIRQQHKGRIAFITYPFNTFITMGNASYHSCIHTHSIADTVSIFA